MCQREQQMRNLGRRRDEDDDEPPHQRRRYEPGVDDLDEDSVSLVLEDIEASPTVQINDEEYPGNPQYWRQDPSSQWMEEIFFNDNSSSGSDPDDLSLSEESVSLNDSQQTDSISSLSDDETSQESPLALDHAPESPEQLVPTAEPDQQSGFLLPLQSAGQVYGLEEFLAEHISNVEVMLPILIGAAEGTGGVMEATGRVMAEILTNRVAAQFSWDGTVSMDDGVATIPFATFVLILKAVIVAVKRIIPRARKQEIESNVKDWLDIPKYG